jgi:hypothetical protein
MSRIHRRAAEDAEKAKRIQRRPTGELSSYRFFFRNYMPAHLRRRSLRLGGESSGLALKRPDDPSLS